MKKTTSKSTKSKPRGKTEFGHIKGTYSGKIDEALLKAKKPLTADEIMKQTGCKPYKVKSHTRHLQRDKGVKIKIENNTYQLIK